VNRPEERLSDWINRAVKYYREGLKAYDERDEFLAHEYGAIAHDLARAADHAHKAALRDHRDPGLPPPPGDFGPEDASERVLRDLNRAYDRIRESGEAQIAASARFYLQASRDLYSAARQDAEAGRMERAGELARAAEAMTHVVEHLGHVAAGPPTGRGRPGLEPAPRREPPPPDDPETKTRRGRRRDADLPPPLPPS
jgi:hypothetical protein